MDSFQNNKAIIITGGPGMGKTSIIDQFHELGYEVVHESGRAIIKQQLSTGGDKLPWSDREAFAHEMFQQSITDYHQQRQDKYIFFDRGLPDVIGYLLFCKLAVPEEMWIASENQRYNRKVFITPPWEQIYLTDKERKQSFEEATATYNIMHELYHQLGYEVMKIPKSNVSSRIKFILSSLGIGR